MFCLCILRNILFAADPESKCFYLKTTVADLETLPKINCVSLHCLVSKNSVGQVWNLNQDISFNDFLYFSKSVRVLSDSPNFTRRCQRLIDLCTKAEWRNILCRLDRRVWYLIIWATGSNHIVYRSPKANRISYHLPGASISVLRTKEVPVNFFYISRLSYQDDLVSNNNYYNKN